MKKDKQLALIDRIDELVSLEATPIKENEFTIDSYIDRLKLKGIEMSYNTSQKRLKELVDKKILTSRSVKFNGMRVNAYSFINENH